MGGDVDKPSDFITVNFYDQNRKSVCIMESHNFKLHNSAA
jgi:hypothetical protein